MTRTASQLTDVKGQPWPVLGIWLLFGAAMIWFGRDSIAQWKFPDPDDAMRLMQVRDWLAGQSWFDVTQYRLSPPVGGPMHWSRLVDLPIAAVILVVRPILSQHGAETAALIAVPLITLLITMLLVHRVALRLLDGPAALLATTVTPLSLGAMKQMRMLRIDHHGWQIVLALVGILAMLDRRPMRSGLVAGAAMALWLNISIEGLPFATATGAWFALEWLRNASASRPLTAYAASLAGASVLLFAVTHAPSTWSGYPHDAINPAHLAALAIVAVGCLIGVRPGLADVWLRIVVLSATGVAAIAAMFVMDPNVLQGPFASLDPIVRDFWYQGVDEGMPVWRLSPSVVAIAMAQPLVGLGGSFFAIRKTPVGQRSNWIAFTWMLGAATIASLFVIREATTASVISLPGTAFVCAFALLRARQLAVMPLRALATAGALCILAPAYAVPVSITPLDSRFARAIHSSDSCSVRSQVELLRALPPSNLAIPMDITPAILASTPHTAIASGYHRNVAGIRDVILLFLSPPQQGRAIITRRKIDYVVYCPDTTETLWWATHGPSGLAAALNANRPPEWLEPVHISGLHSLRVWRVRKDHIAGPHP